MCAECQENLPKNGGGTISMGPVPRFWCPQIFLFVNRVSFQLWKWGGSLKKIRLSVLCFYKAIGIKRTLPNENSTNHWLKERKEGWKEEPFYFQLERKTWLIEVGAHQGYCRHMPSGLGSLPHLQTFDICCICDLWWSNGNHQSSW